MANNTAANVGVGKPKAGGAIFAAPKGTAVPTDAITALGEAFKCLGYISEDGLTESESRETESITAWGGDTVRKVQTSYEKTLQFTCIEGNAEAYKLRFGKDNVTVDASGNVTIKHNSAELDHVALVIELVPTADRVKRLCVPDAQVTEVEDITYTDSDAIGLGMTLSCYPDSGGQSVYEYDATVASEN